MHTHYTCAIIWRFLPREQELEFLVLDYWSIDPNTGQRTSKQLKFPGGTNKDNLAESVFETVFREVKEETNLMVLNGKRIWVNEVNHNHTRYGYLINIDDCRGSLRITPMNDSSDELSPPYWLPAKTLGRTLFHSHQAPFLAACRELGIM